MVFSCLIQKNPGSLHWNHSKRDYATGVVKAAVPGSPHPPLLWKEKPPNINMGKDCPEKNQNLQSKMFGEKIWILLEFWSELKILKNGGREKIIILTENQTTISLSVSLLLERKSPPKKWTQWVWCHHRKIALREQHSLHPAAVGLRAVLVVFSSLERETQHG